MTVIVGLAAGVLLVAVGLRLFENRFIFFPPRYPEGFTSSEGYGLTPESVWFSAQDGVKLNAWYVAPASSPKVVLWFHGNAENIGMGVEQLQGFAKLGVGVLAVDYRGYGRSEGTPDEPGVYRDADAAYRYLVETPRLRPQDIVVYGHSLGGAVAIDLAARHPIGGLIVESSFTSARDMARLVLPLPFFRYAIRSRFDSISKIRQVRAPVLIIHGDRDPVIPFWMGERLFEAAAEPKAFYRVSGAPHDGLFALTGPEYWSRLEKFIAGL